MGNTYTDRDIRLEAGMVFLGISLLWGFGMWLIRKFSTKMVGKEKKE